MWEVLLSMHLLQNQDGPLVFGRWRKQVAGRAGRRVWGGVRLLAPPRGYSPDFLTPTLPEPGGELDDGIEALLSTPRHRLRDVPRQVPPVARRHLSWPVGPAWRSRVPTQPPSPSGRCRTAVALARPARSGPLRGEADQQYAGSARQ